MDPDSPNGQKPLLSIRLFGPFEARVDGVPVPALRSRKGHWLLALLAIRQGSAVERNWLAAALWPDIPEAAALHNLRNSLTDLRRALGPAGCLLQAPTPRTLRLDAHTAEVDLAVYDVAVKQTDRHSLEQAVELYRGPLLEECVEEWVLSERQRREEGYLSALKTLARQALDAGELSIAEGYLRRAVAVDPLRESVQRSLMKTLAAGGSYAAALLVYRELRHRLYREVNAAPDPETTALYQQLQADARQRGRSAHSGPPHNLPVPPTRLVGREQELDAVHELLLRQETRLVTLTGPGGAGKTRVGLQVAAQVLDRFPDGVFLVALAAVSDPGLVTSAIAQTLGVREISGHSLLESVKHYLSERNTLLLLDNFEQVAPAAPAIAELLEAAAGLKVLVTSRAVLHLRGEKEFPVPPLAVPDLRRLPAPARLSQYAAVALFIQRAQDVRPDFRLTSENAPAVAAICHRLDGLPLAIELAAARVRLLPPQALLRRLERRLELLTGGPLDLPARQQTLRNTIAWSYDLLDEAEKTLFRRLSVFVGGCTLEAAVAVGNADEGLGTNALDGITSLLEKSLLQQVEAANGEPRIRMLETIRECARDQLMASGEAGGMQCRHAQFFLHAAEEWQSHFEEGRARFHMEHDNFRAALDWSVESGEVEAGLRLVGALWWYWWGQGHWAEGRQRIEQLLAMEQGQRRTAARARALEAAGWLAKPVGDLAAARAFTEEAVSIWQELGERFGVASCQVSLGQVAWNLDGPAAAQALFEAALATMREVGDRAWEGHCLANLGDLAAGSGNWERAEELYEHSLALFRELDSRSNVADALGKLGQIASSRAEYGRAAELYRESFAVYQKVPKPNKMFVGRYLVGLGQIAEIQGSLHRAVRLFGAASRIYEELWDNEGQMDQDQDLDAAREALGQEEFGAAWEDGHAMSLEQAIAHALDGDTCA